MLAEITIRDLGIIPHAHAELSPGFTVLTGETGAGKTMVVTGLRLLSGGRADASRVRMGASSAVVEGSFSAAELLPQIQEQVAAAVADAGGAADENGEYLASRTVSSSGRSRAHLGGRAVPATTLREFTTQLLTIHGQNDQLRLLSPDKQLEALDTFDPNIAALRTAYQEKYRTWRELAQELKKRTTKRRELAQEVDRLRFAIDEIAAVDPRPGEDTQLQSTITRLQDVDSLREAALGALVALDGPAAGFGTEGADGEEQGAQDLVGAGVARLQDTTDEQLTALAEQLSAAGDIISGVSAELGQYLSDLPADPEELDNLLTRQHALKALTRKYAADADGIIAWKAKAEKKLASIDVSAEGVQKLKEQEAQAQKAAVKAAARLTAARQSAAAQLGEAVTQEIRGLSMPKATLAVQLSATELSATGADAVEFLLQQAAGARQQPLAQSASGGELSRVMLALEVVLSAGSTGETLVFDEVDAGVGGRAAVEIGRRLARLARRHQVIVVTHLPQVAAFADQHVHVVKTVGDASVDSAVKTLSDEERVEELARMLAGLDDTDTGRAHAKELLLTAHREKAAQG